MEDISELYKELILEASKNPHGKKESFSKEGYEGKYRFIHAFGFNSSCGDEVEVEVKMENEIIRDLSWRGSGCVICISSLSMMTDLVIGKNEEEAKDLFYRFLKMMNGRGKGEPVKELKDAASLQGVAKFPMRIKCALLGWSTLKEALEKQDNPANACPTCSKG